MKDSAYAFSVSAVRVREKSLLTRAQIETLVTAPNEASVLRLLEDYGYNGITTDPEGAISEKLSEITGFVNSVCPEKDTLSFLFIKNDFHNLKAAMKCAVSGIDPDPYFLPSAAVSTYEIKKSVEEKRFDRLPEIFSVAKDAWESLVRTMNGQLCEVILDRAAIEASVKMADAMDDKFCAGLAAIRAKSAAVLIALRCAAAGKNKDFVNTALPEIDGVDKKALVTAALAGVSAVAELAAKLCINVDGNASAKDAVLAAEALERDYTLRSVFVSMGTAPILSYYLRAEREISRVRVILSCKRLGIGEDVIRERAGV